MKVRVPKRARKCVQGGEKFTPGSKYVSHLEEDVRSDYCASCWAESEKEGHHWRGEIPPVGDKPKTPDERAYALFVELAEEDVSAHAHMLSVLSLYMERTRQLIRSRKKDQIVCEFPETGEAFQIPHTILTAEESEAIMKRVAQELDG